MSETASGASPVTITPATTLAILLGASSFPKTTLSQPASFANSANDFHQYLLREDGLGLAADNVLNLFDTDLSPDKIQEEIAEWIQRRRKDLGARALKPRDLIFYYVGHGSFASPGEQYIFAIRSTRKNHEGVSSVKIVDVASTFLEVANDLRRYFILDCCFAAAAVAALQSPLNEIVRQKTLAPFPPTGTTVLCASDAHDSASAPADLHHTIFTGTLLTVLRDGEPTLEADLSMNTLGTLVRNRIRDSSLPYTGLPEVHTPVQNEGNIASLELFPNAAIRRRTVSEQIRRIERRLNDVEAEISKTRASATSAAEILQIKGHFQSLFDTQAAQIAEILQSRAIPSTATLQDAELWDDLSANIRMGIQRYQNSRRNGYVWLLIATVLLMALVTAFYYNLPIIGFRGYANPLFWIASFLMVYSTSGFVPLSRVSLVLEIASEREERFLRLPTVLAASQARVRHLFGGFSITNDMLVYSLVIYVANIALHFTWIQLAALPTP